MDYCLEVGVDMKDAKDIAKNIRKDIRPHCNAVIGYYLVEHEDDRGIRADLIDGRGSVRYVSFWVAYSQMSAWAICEDCATVFTKPSAWDQSS